MNRGKRKVTENPLKRIGVSIEDQLLRKFDTFVEQKKYENRSEALRDLIRNALFEQTWEKDDQVVAGSILLFYDHDQRNLTEELTKIQHEMHEHVMATTHFHLDQTNCLELIVVKGKAKEIQELKNKLSRLRGVNYSKVTIAPVENI